MDIFTPKEKLMPVINRVPLRDKIVASTLVAVLIVLLVANIANAIIHA